jgi:hypothetical protein
MQKVLVDRDQLVTEDLVQMLDDFLVAFHVCVCLAGKLISNSGPKVFLCQT